MFNTLFDLFYLFYKVIIFLTPIAAGAALFAFAFKHWLMTSKEGQKFLKIIEKN